MGTEVKQPFTTYSARKEVHIKKPHSLSESWLLGEQAFHQTNIRTSTVVYCEY